MQRFHPQCDTKTLQASNATVHCTARLLLSGGCIGVGQHLVQVQREIGVLLVLAGHRIRRHILPKRLQGANSTI
jgi:hypothetical protein